ncbi:hypothetical protein [Modestobacter sp. SYSU DS0657]
MLWLWLWFLFVVLLFLIPLAYGWGYRGWGAPYPSYYRARRHGATSADAAVDPAEDPTLVEERSWGLLADVLWVVLVVAMVWLVVALVLW